MKLYDGHVLSDADDVNAELRLGLVGEPYLVSAGDAVDCPGALYALRHLDGLSEGALDGTACLPSLP